MPSLVATASASRIISAASSRVSGYWQMSTRVECASALIGLKQTLPHSLSQISARILSSTGDLKPAFWKQAETSLTRSLAVPSSSPSGKARAFDVPDDAGATSSAAG
ncbi:hypothetical protein LO55_1 [Massilia timonae]|uniref:Uncharacterized protein n=1 Tax=Massilia timonae TaxID=47229 RepID=A0A1S2NB28_9BURK|nr:hypothetical protein LO55_1 [Massilia timonae]